MKRLHNGGIKIVCHNPFSVHNPMVHIDGGGDIDVEDNVADFLLEQYPEQITVAVVPADPEAPPAPAEPAKPADPKPGTKK